jgi:outer membrane protein OmpA-like peptidoglycan-associated protein
MTIRRLTAMATLATGLMMSLGACTTLQHGRDRVVRPQASCAPQTVQIYFEPQSAEVTSESAAVIRAAAHGAAGCKVSTVDVLGLADAAGAADASLELSKQRARAVTAALAADGLPAANFKVTAAGQAGATNAAGQDRPLRRRVDVVLHLSPL